MNTLSNARPRPSMLMAIPREANTLVNCGLVNCGLVNCGLGETLLGKCKLGPPD